MVPKGRHIIARISSSQPALVVRSVIADSARQRKQGGDRTHRKNPEAGAQ